jgi:hypothetical protein
VRVPRIPRLPRLAARLPSRDGAAERRAAPLLKTLVRLTPATTERIDRCAKVAAVRLKGEVLKGAVTGAAVVRAAVALWLRDPVQGFPDVVNQAIRSALKSESRHVPRRQYWGREMATRLDEIADTAGKALGRKVKRDAVARVALAARWLDGPTLSELVLQAIREAVVKHGRPAKEGRRASA